MKSPILRLLQCCDWWTTNGEALDSSVPASASFMPVLDLSVLVGHIGSLLSLSCRQLRSTHLVFFFLSQCDPCSFSWLCPVQLVYNCVFKRMRSKHAVVMHLFVTPYPVNVPFHTEYICKLPVMMYCSFDESV